MRVAQEYDGRSERLCVTSLCLDTKVLAAVHNQLKSNSFASKWANIVCDWCLKHFAEFAEAPGPTGIEARFTEWAPAADEALAKIVESWLTGLDPESGLSTDYAIELVRKTAQKASLKKVIAQATIALERGKSEEAAELIKAWERPRIGQPLDGVFPLDDPLAIAAAFEHSTREPLVQYRGSIGEFFGPTLSADCFVSLVAPEKCGKSYWLMDICWSGVAQGRRVALFSVGDMSQSQMLLRLSPKLCRKPLKKGNFRIPTSLTYKDKTPIVEYMQRRSQSDISQEETIEAFQSFRGNDEKRFRLVTEPACSLSAFDISNRIKRWAEEEGYVPEIVVIDYADILADPPGHKERRHAISANWAELRALSTRMKCLVVTATQANASGYESWLLSKSSFSESKTKLAHPTAVFGLNVTDEERRLGVTRLNSIAVRESEYQMDNPGTVLGVAGCSKVGRPAIVSSWLT
jgi:hypothetical protein